MMPRNFTNTANQTGRHSSEARAQARDSLVRARDAHAALRAALAAVGTLFGHSTREALVRVVEPATDHLDEAVEYYREALDLTGQEWAAEHDLMVTERETIRAFANAEAETVNTILEAAVKWAATMKRPPAWVKAARAHLDRNAEPF